MNPGRAQDIFLIGLLLGAAVLAFYVFKPFIIPLALAAIFAVVLAPVHRRIRRWLGAWESVAALLTVVVGVLFIVAPIAILSSLVVGEARSFYETIEGGGLEPLERALVAGEVLLVPYVPAAENLRETVSENLDAYARQAASWVASHLGQAFTSAASFVLALFLFLVSLYYFLRDGETIRRAVMRASPLSTAEEERISERLARAINAVVRGNLLIALIQGAVSTIGFVIFGVPNAILWGTAAGFAALIPGLGTSLVLVPVILFLFLSGDVVAGIGLAAWGAAAVGSVDNVLGPRLVGGGMQLHPLLILPGVLGGIALFGPAGIFLGPLVLALLFALLSVYAARQPGIDL